MTESAIRFVTPLTFQALSSHPVQTELLDAEQENAMGHINLARWADFIVIAPATANVIAKLAHGLADDLVSTLSLAAESPVYFAPAMNQAMWNKQVTQDNVKRLQDHGMTLIPPDSGEMACGESGTGRMAEPETICQRVSGDKLSLLSSHHLADDGTKENRLLEGVRVLISAGPTREPLDPVRYISNRSSGKMGYALAEAALEVGAKVSLVSGPVNLAVPEKAEVIDVESAEQMYNAVIEKASASDIYIGAAAVADYTPAEVKEQKIKKQSQENILHLQRTKDILAAVAQLPDRPFVVGFAAETDDLEVYARGKLVRKKLDMIAANWVGRKTGGFESDENALQVFWPDGHKALPMTDKKQLATQLLALIAWRRNEKNSIKNTG